MEHEQPSRRPRRTRTRQNEVWRFIIRDEELELQTCISTGTRQCLTLQVQ